MFSTSAVILILAWIQNQWEELMPFYSALLCLRTLALNILTTWNATNDHGTTKKVRSRLARSIDRDLSLESILFAHHVHLHQPPYSIASYKRVPGENIYIVAYTGV